MATAATLTLLTVQACGGPKKPALEPDPVEEPTAPAAAASDAGSPHEESRPPSKDEGGPARRSAEPGRSPQDIQSMVGARRDEARACYDKAQKDHPQIEGDIDIKWTIDPQGNVTDVMVDAAKTSITEPSVGQCLVEFIKKLKFAASTKGFETHAHYPFNFHPKVQPRTNPPAR